MNETYKISKAENVWEDKTLIDIFAYSYAMQVVKYMIHVKLYSFSIYKLI